MSSTSQQSAKTPLPLFQGILPLRQSTLMNDMIAGIVLAALGMPEVMGYTKISGTPIATGLYTLLLPALVFALVGSSRHLVVAADSATAAIVAAGLVGLAQSGSAEYVGLAGLIALITAGLLLLARLFRLGFLADFLSRTVLIGFLTGVGIQVAIGQLGGLLGIADAGHGTVAQLLHTIQNLPQTHWLSVAISVAVLAIIVLFEKVLPKFPGALLAVVGAIIVSWAFNFAGRGVAVVGTVPSGLPSFGLPAVSLSMAPQVLSIALSCCIVIIAQSAATSRAYAFRYNEHFNENVDLVGLAAANLAAGMTGTFVVNGSPTKTAIVDTAGGRSQVSQITTVAIVFIVVLFLTRPISYLPNATLAAIVFLIGIKLIDLKGLQDIFKTHREEFYLAIATAAMVVFIGVKEGIIFAIALSLLVHVRHSYSPNSAVLTYDEKGAWLPIPVHPGAISSPGVIIYRFSRDVFYANASRFAEEIHLLAKYAASPVQWFILEARAITEIDYSASQTIRGLVQELDNQNIRFVVTGLTPEVKAQFDRDGLTQLIGSDYFFARLGDAMEAFDQTVAKSS